MKHTKTPFNVLRKEVDSIECLFQVTSWAYTNCELNSNNHFSYPIQNGNTNIQLVDNRRDPIRSYSNAGHMKSDLLGPQTKTLCSVLYVRLISALEVYLIDAVRYAFARKPEILSTNKKRIELTHSQIINTKDAAELRRNLITKETRTLHSAGFKEVVKFYDSQLGISLSDLGINLAHLEKCHEMRHLLVHKLGATDSAYRHKYNDKALKVSITKDVFFELINTINDAVIKIDNALESQLANIVDPAQKAPFQCKVSITLLKGVLPPVLEPSYCFVHEDKYLRNSDFFTLEKVSEKEYALHVKCDNEDFRPLRQSLKRLQNKGIINIDDLSAFAGLIKKRSRLPKDHLAKIARMLPKRNNWHVGIHKDLATVLGISNSKSGQIITSILDNSELLKELGKEIHSALTCGQQGDEAGTPDAQLP